MFKRRAVYTLQKRILEPRRSIQVVAGPRQVGKTTLVRQCLETLPFPAHYASADEPTLRDRTWIEQQRKRNATGRFGGDSSFRE